MIAYDVMVDGHRSCVAGVAEGRVLSALLTSIGGTDDILFHVGGIDAESNHVRWRVPHVAIGSTVALSVCELSRVDTLAARYRPDEAYSQFVARELRERASAGVRAIIDDPRTELTRVARTLDSRALTTGSNLLDRVLRRKASPLKAICVRVNGRDICTAGVPPQGNLTANLSWTRGDRCRLSVHGLDSKVREHLRWRCPDMQAGDVAEIRVVNTDHADPPQARRPS
jgi:hypothetical protein